MQSYIRGYNPRVVDPRSRWNEVAKEARIAASRTAVSLPTAKKLCPAIAAFALWLAMNGLDANASTLGDEDLIERYIQTGMDDAAESTKATRRSLLRTMARRLACDGTSPMPEPMPYRRVKPPYTETVVRRYLRLADEQPTMGRRDSMRAVLSLGLGCGLDGRDMAWVTGSCVRLISGDAVEVEVSGGSRPRKVVALHDYADMIAGLAADAGDGLLIGGTTLGRHNVTSAALNRAITDTSLPRLVASRLRSTWLVAHLRLGTPLHVLLPAAGLITARPLEDLLEFVDKPSDEEAALLLRGPG